MDTDIFWEVFRDTGDPLCWLLSRAGASDEDTHAPEDGADESAPSSE